MRGVEAANAVANACFASRPAPALSFAVAGSSGQAMWSCALGIADLEFGVPAAVGHAFRIGSVSKPVTATAAAKLALRGELDLDGPIGAVLPDLPSAHHGTSLRHLLTHRGGIRHYRPADMDPTQAGGSILTRTYRDSSDILALFINDPLVAPPGIATAYSPFGYSLAALVMEAATGCPFMDIVQREIAVPFGLSSLAADDPRIVIPGRVRGYAMAAERQLFGGETPGETEPRFTNMVFSNPGYCLAGAGLLMSAPDLARFGAAVLDGFPGGIGVRERDVLFQTYGRVTEDGPVQGLGWRISADRAGRRRWHHEGATPGGRASLVVYPDLDLSIAIAGNVMLLALDVGQASMDLADAFE